MKNLWREHRGLIVTLVCFVCIALLAVSAMTSLGEKNDARQQEQLCRAVMRAAVACYATEGFYPPDTAYLQEHYGLKWNEDRYIVRYDCFSSNIVPDISVHRRGAE